MIAMHSWSRLKDCIAALRSDEGGQVLPMVSISLCAMLGMAAFGIDMGRAMYTSRQMQASTDAAALAAARAMPTAPSPAAITGINGVVQSYSAANGGYNTRNSLPSVLVTSTLKCLTSLQAQGIPCLGNVPYNAIQVTQTEVLNTFFGGVIGIKTVNLSTVATAATRGGGPRPSNVAVVLDTTLSMQQLDTNCVVNGATLTEEQCAQNGLQVLLQNLSPCGVFQSNCNAVNGVAVNSFDRVALFTFPAVTVATAGIDTGCTEPLPTNNSAMNSGYVAPYGEINMMISGTSNTPWAYLPVSAPYPFPSPGLAYSGLSASSTSPTYQLTNFISDYRVSDATTTLNTASALVKASGAVTGCGGMAPPNWEGDYETYYAGVIYAAQSALVAAQTANPGSENVMVILSDGDSNALQQGGELYANTGYPNMSATPPNGNYLTASGSGVYPSWVNECAQAVTAAQYATAAGTLVYAVGYGSQPAGCKTDNVATTPCATIAGMASASQYFYSDYKQSGSSSTCVASQPYTSLSSIFQAISADLTQARLIPNNTT